MLGANWRESILKHFQQGIARLTLVSDPDGLVTEEGMLTAIKERGFDVIPFEDSIAFRYAYESNYRSRWDEGHRTDLVVLLRADADLEALPYDLLRAANRRLTFSLHALFPNLNYPVLESLDSELLDPLSAAYERQAGSILGANGTKDFVLTHCFRIVPHLISTSVDPMVMLLARHYKNAPIPPSLDEHLLHTLRSHGQFAAWPLETILASRGDFLAFVQAQWQIYLTWLKGDGETCLVPFDHQNVRAYVDTYFLEGLLLPVKVENAQTLPLWVQTGVLHDPRADALARLRKLLDHCREKLPTGDSGHREWQATARTWAELVVLRWSLGPALDEADRHAWETLHGELEERFAAWMLNRFGSLYNLPHTAEPVMVHHIARYLAARRVKDNLSKVALMVVDGLALDQWLVLRRLFEAKRVGWKMAESSVFAWVPTLTSISRQAIFAGAMPLLFPDSLDTTDREANHWNRFWEDQGVSRESVEYAKMIESGQSAELERCLHNPRVAVLGIVANTIDKVMHGEQQGIPGMHDAVRLWADDAASVVARLLQEGFEVFLTADHGNVAAEGMGAPREGVLVEVAGKRARIYENANFCDEAQSQFPDTIQWPGAGLPSDKHVLLPKGLRAFAHQGKHVVSHGGISLEEVVVPFVRISKDE